LPAHRTHIRRALSALVVVAALPVAVGRTDTDRPRTTTDVPALGRIRAASMQLPMRFDPARDPEGRGGDFIARGPNYAVSVSATHATIHLSPSSGTTTAAITMRLIGASQNIGAAVGRDALPGLTNHLAGNDPRLWRTGVQGYAKVQYRDVYPGVDVVYYGNQRQLEYDFVVAPGGRPSDIVIAFDGVRTVTVTGDGALRLLTADGELRQAKPVVYQEINGARHSIDGAFVADRGGRVRFRVGRYDARLPLIIDPVLAYSSYLGGGAGDAAMGVAVDGDGNIYLAGETASLDFPHAGGAQPTSGGGGLDAFVAKLNPAGDELVYATYLGGSSSEYAKDIAVDAAGNAYVVGSTTSRNFPTVHALRQTLGGFSDGFVTKLDMAGLIVYSTYLGGSKEDYGYGIAVDATGRAHVTGQTISADFPTIGALQPGLGGGALARTVNGGSTWTGLSSLNAAYVVSIAVDPRDPDVIYAGTDVGVAKSVDGGQTWGPARPEFPSVVWDIAIDPITTSTVYAATDQFIMRSRDGGATWTWLYGGNVTSLAIDPTAPATIYAGTQQSSSSLGVVKSTDGGAHWTNIGMGTSVWSLGLSPSSPSTIYAGGEFGMFKTTTGGVDRWEVASTGLHSRVRAVAVDPVNPSIVYAGTEAGLFKTTSGGNQWTPIAAISGMPIWAVAIPAAERNTIHVGSLSGGTAVSRDGGATWTYGHPDTPIYSIAADPSAPGTVYVGSSGQWDAFAARLSPDGSALEYSTYLGGASFEYGNAIALDSTGSAYIVGATTSVDFPVVNPLQAAFAGTRDLFVAKISPQGGLVYATYLGGSMWEDGGTIAVDAAGRAHVAGYTLSSNFPTVHAYQAAYGGSGDAFVATINSTGASLDYSTFLGGSSSEMGPGAYLVGRDPVVSVAVTPNGETYLTGTTASANFPTLRAVQPAMGGGAFDAFVAKFSADGVLRWSTFLGGTGDDAGKRVALGPTGDVVVAGVTASGNFPTRDAMQAGSAGPDDAFVARLVQDAAEERDVNAPLTTITASGTAGLAGWYRSSVGVTLTATDGPGESGVAFVDSAVNGGPFDRYREPFVIEAQGASTVSGRATDNAGNVETVPATAVVKIDSLAPTLVVTGVIERDYLHTDAVTLGFSAHDDLSGLASGTPSATLDGAPVTNGRTIQLLTLRLGAHTLAVSASDAAGNSSRQDVTFRVVATLRSLMAAVDVYAAQGQIDPSVRNSLIAKLNDAQAALDRQNATVVRNKLADFIDTCRKRLAVGVASVLIADAQYILVTL
jgi:hypothetical protein